MSIYHIIHNLETACCIWIKKLHIVYLDELNSDMNAYGLFNLQYTLRDVRNTLLKDSIFPVLYHVIQAPTSSAKTGFSKLKCK